MSHKDFMSKMAREHSMRIAICDDDVKMAAQIEGVVESCRDMTNIEAEAYLSGEEVVKALNRGEVF